MAISREMGHAGLASLPFNCFIEHQTIRERVAANVFAYIRVHEGLTWCVRPEGWEGCATGRVLPTCPEILWLDRSRIRRWYGRACMRV